MINDGLGDAIIHLKDQMAATSDEVLGLKTAFETVIDNNSYFLLGFKIAISSLAVLFILIRMLQSISDNAEQVSKGKDPIFGQKEIILSIVCMFSIMFFTPLFNFAEFVLVELSSAVGFDSALSKEIWSQSLNTFLIQAARDITAQGVAAGGNFSIFGWNFEGVAEGVAIAIAPNKFVYTFSAVGALVGFFNYLLSIMAYMDRSLLLLIFNCLAPLIFALYPVKGGAVTIKKFFLMYIVVFLILPFLLITFQIVDMMYINLSSIGGIYDTIQAEADLANAMNSFGATVVGGTVDAADALASVTNYDIFLRLPLLLIVVAIKIKSMSLITNSLWKIIS